MKYSIGIPAYKASFLKECISSILEQTYPDFELIILNDASPENIDEVVRSFTDVRIRYYKNKENFGAVNVVDNWNKCLSYAQGEYFVLMGDDDKMKPDYLAEFSSLIKKHPLCGVYHCRVEIIDEQSNFITLTEARPEYESVFEAIWHRITGKRMQFISDFVFHRVSLIEKGGFYKIPLAWASDDITAYTASIENGIANTNNPVFNYRRSNNTISSTGRLEFKLKAIKEEELWLNNFLLKTPSSSEIDSSLHQMITKYLTNYISSKIIFTLALDFKHIKLLKMRYWYKVFKKNNISLSIVFYSFIKHIKDRRISVNNDSR